MEFTVTTQDPIEPRNSIEPPVDGLDVKGGPFYFTLVMLQVMSPSRMAMEVKQISRWYLP
jgi:hypothetical protein